MSNEKEDIELRKEQIKQALIQAGSIDEACGLILGNTFKKRCFFSPFADQTIRKAYAEDYNKYFAHRLSSYKSTLENFLTQTTFLHNMGNVVDLGCGSGLFLGLLSRAIGEDKKIGLYGIDFSEEMLGYTRYNLKHMGVRNVVLIKGDIAKLKGLCISFNLKPKYLFSLNVLHQIKNPKKFIKDALDVLEPNGQIFIETIIRDSDWNKKRQRLIHLVDVNLDLFIARFKGHLSALTKNEIKLMLDDLGVIKYKMFVSERTGYYDETLTIIITKEAIPNKELNHGTNRL